MTVINIDSFTLESGCNVVQAGHFQFHEISRKFISQHRIKHGSGQILLRAVITDCGEQLSMIIELISGSVMLLILVILFPG